MWKRLFIMLVIAELFIAALAFVKVRQIMTAMSEGPKHAPPPPAVTTFVAHAQKWQPTLNAIGSLKSINGVDVSTDLAGIVSQIAFESGAAVKKGDLLVRLDTKQESAQLQSAEARRQLSAVNLARQRDLLIKKAAAQSEFDTAAAQARQDEAAVEETRALIARKTIVAPFDGVLGIRQVDIGQFLNVGSPIVTLQSQNPIHVEFSIPQQDIDHIAIGGKLQLKAAGMEGVEFEGRITAINSKIDEATRNMLVEGTVPNPDGKLRAGMFVDVHVLQAEQSGVIAIPASAVNYAPYGDSVFTVATGSTAGSHEAIQHFVKLGPTRGDQVAIASGVNEGDEVVTSGVFKLRSHAPVTVEKPVAQPVIINNTVLPGNEANPKPPET